MDSLWPLSFVLGYLLEPLFCIRVYPSTKRKQPFYNSQLWKGICERVLKRDKFICRHCGATENLHVHHKTDTTFFNPPLRHLITLCASCHKKEHHRLKKVNEERKQIAYKILIFVYVVISITITKLVYA